MLVAKQTFLADREESPSILPNRISGSLAAAFSKAAKGMQQELMQAGFR
jgi:hypothetical protein